MADIMFLEELNKISSFSCELDLGFSLTKFTSSYKKRFHNNNYNEYSITFNFNERELNLFFLFFEETLKYGTLKFQANFFGELETFDITKMPEYNRSEADNYNLILNVIKIENVASQELLDLNSYLENFLNTLNGVDSSVEANTAASIDSLELALFYYNFYNIITKDINIYKEKENTGGF